MAERLDLLDERELGGLELVELLVGPLRLAGFASNSCFSFAARTW